MKDLLIRKPLILLIALVVAFAYVLIAKLLLNPIMRLDGVQFAVFIGILLFAARGHIFEMGEGVITDVKWLQSQIKRK